MIKFISLFTQSFDALYFQFYHAAMEINHHGQPTE